MRSSTRRRRWAFPPRTTPQRLRAFRPRLERVEERWVPAAVSEFPLTTAAPAPQEITAGPDGALWYSAPADIASGPDGNLWYTASGTDRIGRINLTGAVTEFAVPGAGSAPFGIAA